MRLARLLFTLAFLVLPATGALAQAGKLAGVVTDAVTGDELPGVNVAIEGTTQGAVTNAEGYYVILNVRPGTYTVRASFIGYTPVAQENVRVNIDLTTEINFQIQEETVGLQEIVVAAARPVVQRDVSASVANISAEEIENLPVTDVEKVIGLQAGFERGMTIRGGSGSQVQFMVDGISTQSGRGNTPFTGISYTGVEEVQVQTGGFNAEYGNVRTGLVNIVTKEGSTSRYEVDAIVRYSPASQKYFSGYDIEGNEIELPNSDNAYFVRPYYDPAVSSGGTSSGAWDQYMIDSYPAFTGWQALTNAYNQSEGTTVTQQQMQEAFRWYLRKDFEIQDPDYEVDATISGPFPVVSQLLGNLRFTASYRQEQSAFVIPMIRENYTQRTGQGKITSDLRPGMKLVLSGMYAKQMGINPDEGNSSFRMQSIWTGDMPYYPWDTAQEAYMSRDIGGNHIFANEYRNPMDVSYLIAGGKLTHALSGTTFYEVQLQRSATEYNTFATAERDPTVIQCAVSTGGSAELVNATNGACPANAIPLNEEPFGWEWRDTYDITGAGLRTGGHWYSARDSSTTSRWDIKFDLTSQLNRYSQIKTGLQYIYSNYDTNFGEVDPAHPHHANPLFVWERSPQQGALYAQNKLEFKGMIANLGLRLEYFHAGGDWYDFTPFSRVLTAQFGRDALDSPEALAREDWGTTSTARQFSVSPRLGVSFPITENSKLYFNYGHFREMPNPMDIFNVSQINTGAVDFIGNPDLPLPKTVMYELGFEQNVADMFLLRVAGYYKDLSSQGRGVRYVSIDEEVDYIRVHPYGFQDTRGLELTLTKNRGNWIRGFINYTYLSNKYGNFGFSNIYENRVAMRNYLLTSTDYYPSTPIPEPFGRFNLELLIPEDLGPELAGGHPLGDWRINFLGEWRQGLTGTWNGQTLQGGRSASRELQDNIRTRAFYTLDMRFSKAFNASFGQLQVFADLTNVLNIRHMYNWGGGDDGQRYVRSLHLPEETFEGLLGGRTTAYTLVPGDDQVGDYRKPGVPFVPIRPGDLPATGAALAFDLGDYDDTGYNSPLYYVENDCSTGDAFCGGTYYQWTGSSFVEADDSFVDKVLDDKAYIDMPNLLYDTFLNPRNVFFGMRVTF